ncbi:MAG: hypothetical protein ONB49_21380, partial [candidate division KSB1 bacterium]|nr:hypothetical protein [candidate division KSB1 bacterium]
AAGEQAALEIVHWSFHAKCLRQFSSQRKLKPSDGTGKELSQNHDGQNQLQCHLARTLTKRGRRASISQDSSA